MKILRGLTVSFFVGVFFFNVFPVKYGSNSAVSVQPFVVFPKNDIDNEMLSFGWFKSGFSLEDYTTTCTFSSIFPISGIFDLRGGSLFLNSDLGLANVTTLSSMGMINGAGHLISLDSSILKLENPQFPVVFKDVDIYVNSDLSLAATVKFEGTCQIYGRDKRLYLDPKTQIEVGHNSSLTLRSLQFEGVRYNNINCIDETGKLYLDNVSLYMDRDYSFSIGQIEVWNQVDINGTHTFFYDSLQTLTVAENSIFNISDGATLAVATKRNLVRDRILYLKDQTAKMGVDNANVIFGPSGCQLTRGVLALGGKVNYDIRSTDTEHGLILGDGTLSGDVIAEFYPASYITFVNGHVVYNESDPYKFISQSSYSKLVRGPTNTFHIKKNQIFNNVTITVDPRSPLTVDPGTSVGYQDCGFIMPTVKFTITGSRYNSYTMLLGGNDEIFLQDGVLPFYLAVQNGNNTIDGSGSLSGVISLIDSGSSLILSIDGYVLNDVILNGGTIYLAKDLRFSYDKAFKTYGVVNLSNNNLSLGANDLCWTSSIYWDGLGGNLNLNSKVSLSSTWTFSGNCTVCGNSNILDLGTLGNIYVERGSTLRLKNIVVQGFSGKSIQCVDSAGKIVLDDANVVMDGDFDFDKGGIIIHGAVDVSGTYTFFYDSLCTMSIRHNSSMLFKGGSTIGFGVKRPLAANRVISYEDSTASFILDDSNFHFGSQGLQFLVGALHFSGQVNVDCDSTSTANGLIIGDGTAANDPFVMFDSGSSTYFKNGYIVCNLFNPNNMVSASQSSKVSRAPANVFYLKRDVIFANTTLRPDPRARIINDPGAIMSFEDCKMVLPTVKFSFSGIRCNEYTNGLNGGDELFLEDGLFPIYLLVSNKSNYIRGSGDVGGMTTLSNSGAEINFDLAGQVLNHILLNGGKMALAKDLDIGINSYILGPGTINLSGYDLSLASKDFIWTSSIYWDGNGGKLNLNSKVALTGTWTFSGNCTIVGNNNPLIFKTGGRIYVERGSTLNFKNIIIYGLQGTNLSCVDDTSKIVFNGVTGKLIGDYYFKKGSFDMSYVVDLKATNYTFHYQSTKQSNITNCTIFTMHTSAGFDYSPACAAKNLINLQGKDAVIWLKAASLHSSSTGMRLTAGRLFIEDQCFISSDASCTAEAIEFGDGISPINDLELKVLPGGNFDLTSGYVVSKNIFN